MTEKEKSFVKNYSLDAARLKKILEREPSMGTVAAVNALIRDYKKKYPKLVLWSETMNKSLP